MDGSISRDEGREGRRYPTFPAFVMFGEHQTSTIWRVKVIRLADIYVWQMFKSYIDEASCFQATTPTLGLVPAVPSLTVITSGVHDSDCN